jgi:hypothetical protein
MSDEKLYTAAEVDAAILEAFRVRASKFWNKRDHHEDFLDDLVPTLRRRVKQCLLGRRAPDRVDESKYSYLRART